MSDEDDKEKRLDAFIARWRKKFVERLRDIQDQKEEEEARKLSDAKTITEDQSE